METKNFNDILSEFSETPPFVRKNKFIDRLLGFIDQRYFEEKNKAHRPPRLAEDYAGIFNEELVSVKRNFNRLLKKFDIFDSDITTNNSTVNVSRELVIRIVFVLVSERKDRKEKDEKPIFDKDGKQITFVEIKDKDGKELNGLEIANLLLRDLGYYRLPASSVSEFIYYYSLKNNKTIEECRKLREEFCKRLKEKYKNTASISASLKMAGNTTYYREKADSSRNDDEFIKTMLEIEPELNANSKWLTKRFLSSILDIEDNLNSEKNKERIKLLSNKMLLTYGDFFATFSNKGAFKTKKELKQVFVEFAKGMKTSSLEDLSSFFSGYFLPPLKSQFKTLVKNIQMITQGKTTISREGFCLWLLYAYPDLDSEKIDAILQKRFDVLNKDVYFDRFVTYVSNFSLREGKVYYKDVLSEEEKEYLVEFNADTEKDIWKDNLSSFRKSIVSNFIGEYYQDMAVSFINNKNSVIG